MPKVDVTTMLVVIAVLLALILWKISKIEARSRERFPAEKEADYDWSQKDPMGHWEAHKDDKKK
jgi:Na+-transporting methylmalonyl-CoA/oxaloacetate decarboxylase gamma subunit